jgi:thioredoxin-like negative regulator of GroEL
MIDRRHLLKLIASAPLVGAFAPHAFAAERQFYKAAAFDAALAEKRPVLVEIWASWCPTCKAQEPILKRLSAMPKYGKVLMLTADFDVERELLARLKVRQQSTLIVFKNGVEVARTVGDTNAERIEALLDKAI